MTFDREILFAGLTSVAKLASWPQRFVVAFSGGLDSTAMLHALAASQAQYRISITAVHVDHGLQPDSAAWRRQCRAFAASIGVDFVEMTVDVDTASGQGTEAAARAARYGAFRKFLKSGDWLLSAHHKDDQAETLLLNLMRGSGPAGLAGIGEMLPLGAGWLVRPLLSFSRSELEDYAALHDLSWIDDPSNEDRQYDRNYIRHEVMPLFAARWPDAAGRLKRSAVLAGEASQLLDQLADADFQELGDRPDRLALDKLRQLRPERQRNLLRYVIRELGLPTPPARQLQSVITELLCARVDAQPVVQWPGAEIRRYRDSVYVLARAAAADTSDPAPVVIPPDTRSIALGPGLGELSLEPDAAGGIAKKVLDAGLEVRFRSGGEEIKPLGQMHTRKLKKLLQEEGVVPWMREKLPLLYSAGELVAVADLWVAESAASAPGTAVRWRNRPAIH